MLSHKLRLAADELREDGLEGPAELLHEAALYVEGARTLLDDISSRVKRLQELIS